MDSLDKIIIGLQSFLALMGVSIALLGFFRKAETKKEKQIMIIIGLTLFGGSSVLLIEQLFF